MRFILVVAVVAGCSDPSELVVSSERQGIIGGSQTHVGQFPSVVAVYETKAGALCTGTLISPTVVITAAHCVDPAELGRTQDEIVAETVVIFDNVDLNQAGGTVVHAMNVLENPLHPDFTSQPIDFGHDDDALIVLPAPVTDRATSPIDLGTDSKLGVMTTQVGFGIHTLGTQEAGEEFYLTNKPVVGCAIMGPNYLNIHLVCFDENNKKGQCNGDSGGPAFDPQGHIIGVVSFGDLACAQGGADTRPGQTKDFIVQNVPELADGVCVMDGVCNLSCPSDPDCVPLAPYCGDGVMQAGEVCDLGSDNGIVGTGCSSTCTPVAPECGNGVVETGEDCDHGSANNGQPGNTCNADCTNYVPPKDSGGCSGASSSSLGMGVLLALGLISRRRSRC